jgi:hypothetical protein
VTRRAVSQSLCFNAHDSGAKVVLPFWGVVFFENLHANMRLLCHLDIYVKYVPRFFWMYLVNFLALKKLLACKYLHAKDFWFVSWLLSKFANEPWNVSICHANISQVEMQKLFRCCGCKSNFKLTVSSLKKWSTPNELTIQLFSRRRILLSI